MLKFTSYFQPQELQKYAGLLSFLKLSTIVKFIKYLAKGIKALMGWAVVSFGVSNLGDMYEKTKEDPTAIFDPENRKTTLNPWRENEGPFENLFRIGTYAFPAFNGFFGGTMMFVLDKVLSKEYGAGFEDLGKLLDQKLGLKAGNKVDVNDSQIESALSDILKVEQKETKPTNSLKELKQLLGE